MLLTIVIPTFNRANVLRDLLVSLSGQTDLHFEVVVAIDGATDHTESILSEIKTPYELRWVNTHERGYGLAVARNLGILEAKGEAIVLIDDDCFPVPGFVAAHKASVRKHTITGGLRTPGDTSDTRQVSKMQELSRLPACEALSFETLRRDWPNAVTTECNICMLRSDIIELGLFSERLKLYGFIGQEFFARAINADYRYQYNPEAEVVHRRQVDGDNNLGRWRKKREIMIAKALRPAFLTPKQYAIQAEWARCMGRAYPERCRLPSFPKRAWVFFPYRFVRNRGGDILRWVRKTMRHGA